MKLLVVTQAVDQDDPGLGFFHGWLEEFSKHAEKITVVCLKEGRHALPPNVVVLSLGKELGRSRVTYLARFCSYIWRKRDEYDTVFVHMNQEYVLLAGLLWRMWGKKILLWRNHKKGSLPTDLAVALSRQVFYTSPDSYTAQFKKALKMPAGIDTDTFTPHPDVQKVPHSLLFLGRISPVKRVELFIKALHELKNTGETFTALIVGDPVNPEDFEYERNIRSLVNSLQLSRLVTFKKSVKNTDTVALYNGCAVYVNLTPSGSMDKTILEAMASGIVPVVSNTAFRGTLPAELIIPEPDARAIASALRQAMKSSCQFRDYAVREHSLKRLAGELFRSDRVNKP